MKKLKLLALILSAVLVLSVCPQCFAEQVYTPGTYTAEANGNNGAVSVSVTFSENAITDVVVGAHSETAGISDPAIERLPKAIVENQSLAVDAVSGTTNTSNAILSAVEACVLLAGGDVEALKNAAVEEKENDSVQQLSCDIVVVGGGLSGLCAAAAATEMGASVICVEKLAVTGGSGQGSLGGFMACEIPENAEYHVTTNTFDSLDQALDTWIGLQDVSIVESKYPDRERLSKALVECMHTFDWLSSYGAEFVAYTHLYERIGESDCLAIGADCARVLHAQHFADVWHDEGYFGFHGIHRLMETLRSAITAPADWSDVPQLTVKGEGK